jgi:hypothetical protein
MTDKETSNTFKFSLMQEGNLFCEKIFDADLYSPYTRYSVDIRDVLPKIISGLQVALSRKDYSTVLDVGEGKSYDLGEYSEPPYTYDKYEPKFNVIEIGERTIKGVEFKIGLYINENPIVERVFYVDGFNPDSKNSTDILYEVINISDMIEEIIKKRI